jgi:hypothetical protein
MIKILFESFFQNGLFRRVLPNRYKRNQSFVAHGGSLCRETGECCRMMDRASGGAALPSQMFLNLESFLLRC